MEAARKDDMTEPTDATEDRWMSLLAAALEIGCAPATVKTLALKGALISDFVAGRVVVRRDTVAAEKARRATTAARR